MIIDAINATDEEIVMNANSDISTTNPIIMYLKNNGISDYKWDIDKAKVFLMKILMINNICKRMFCL